jgi:hypothetical protein
MVPPGESVAFFSDRRSFGRRLFKEKLKLSDNSASTGYGVRLSTISKVTAIPDKATA